MKKFLLLSFIVCVFFKADAQTNETKSSIGITIGPSFPTGDFTSKDLNNSQSGLAKLGAFLAIDYGYKFSKNFGVMASVQGRIYGIDVNAFKYAVPEGTGAGLTIDAGAWEMFNFMAGIFQAVPLTKNEKLNLEIKALAGYQSSASPKLDLLVSVPGMGSFRSIQEKEHAGAMAFAVGAGLKYKLDNRLALKLMGDYIGSSPKFTIVNYPADAPVEQKVRQNIGAFNLGVGLAFDF